MTEEEKRKILLLSERDFELRKLLKEHQALEARLVTYGKRPFLTTVEQQDVKALKRGKLLRKDKMMRILVAHSRHAHDQGYALESRA